MLVYLVLMYDSALQDYYVLKPPITNMDIELLVSLEPDEPGARISVNVMFKPTREKGRAIGSKFNCALHVGGEAIVAGAVRPFHLGQFPAVIPKVPKPAPQEFQNACRSTSQDTM